MAALISVIIPIYKVEQYLARCLDSVINQTYQNLEIILVNDGTPDGSVAIAEAYQARDARIKILHQDNAGVSQARNRGLEAATGDYIAFLDSDDWLELDAYAYLLDLLEKEGADMAVGGLRRTQYQSEGATVSAQIVTVYDQKAYAKRFFKIGSQSIHYYIWNVLYRRDVVAGVRQASFYGEDVLATFMYILNAQKVVVSDKVVYNYFVNPAGQTAVFDDKHFDVLTVWDQVLAQAEKTGDADYQAWASFNRKRADFSVLADIALADNSQALSAQYRDRIATLVKDLRQNVWTLVTGPIPLNRKLMILVFALHYGISSRALNALKGLKKS